MLQRWMNSYGPLFAPEGGGAPAAAAPGDGAPAAGDGVAAVVAAEAPAADAAPAPAPSLLEGAAALRDLPKGEQSAATNEPAPADAAKPDGDEPRGEIAAAGEAPADGDKPKPEAGEDKAAEATDPARKGDEPDATAEAPPPAPIKYEAFKLPDNLKLDDKQFATFEELAGGAQVPQETAQKMIDLYVQNVEAMATELRNEQRRVWDTLNDTWKSDLRKDPELGGNRVETSLAIAKAVVEEYGGTDEQKRELFAHISHNGMGNYVGFVRLLHNIGQAMNVFEDSLVAADPSPPKPSRGPGNRGWYDNSNMGGQRPA